MFGVICRRVKVKLSTRVNIESNNSVALSAMHRIMDWNRVPTDNLFLQSEINDGYDSFLTVGYNSLGILQ